MNSNSTTTGQNLAKEKYRSLKRKFKFLVYENECYQEELRNLQRRLLKLSRDKNFLLDRLMQYEKVSDSSDDSDPPAPTATNPSESPKPKKQKKTYPSSKRSRAKQPAAAAAAPNAPMPLVPPPSSTISTSIGDPSAVPSMIPAANSVAIRGRSRKGNNNGAGSSSDAEIMTAAGSMSTNPGMIVANVSTSEMDRIQPTIVQYPSLGVYEQLPQQPPQTLPTDQSL